MAEGATSRPRVVRAGPATALLDGAFLRRVRVGGREVLRGVYAAVRDQNWDTIEPTFSRYELEERADSFRLRFTAEHRRGDVDFVWDGEYVGEPTGRLTFRLDGACRTAFRKNRIGFCVLHPPELAGTPYVRETPAGAISERFPERISPRRDIADMQALRYDVGPIGVSLRFEGDRFDMEDQRNWTDASYKTFCTPLALPYPVQMKAGDRIAQTVTLELRVPPGVGTSRAEDSGPDVVVGERAVGVLPPIGLGTPLATQPPAGAAPDGRSLAAARDERSPAAAEPDARSLAAGAPDARPLSGAALERLRELRPAHLRVELDLRAGADWREVLRVASAGAAALGASLDVALLADADGSGIEDAAAALRSLSVPLVRVAAFAEKVWVTTVPLVARLRACHLGAPVGGGSRTDFAQLNMQAALVPFADLDFVTHAVNPQVHAFDDMSIVETLGAQAETVASARALAGAASAAESARPVVVGPITLRPRFNANATTAESPPPPDSPPAHADPRQATPFAAAWTLSSIHRLAAAGAAALTYHETAGPAGVVDSAGAPYPVYEVLAALSGWTGAELLEVELRDPLAVEALALRRGGERLVLVANLTPDPRTVAVGDRSVELGPYGVARV